VLVDLPFTNNITLRLVDYTGRIWKEQTHFASNGTLEMDVEEVPTGVYFLLVETDQGNSVWKVVKI
jgi:hypothetical protein